MITSASHSNPTLVQRKNYVWVYPQSDRKFTGIIPDGVTLAYENNKKGNVKWVTFSDANGNQIRLECIAIATLASRKSQWVYPDTNIKYKDKISLEALMSAEKDENGYLKFITVTNASGTSVRLERVTAQILKSRKSERTPLGTDNELTGITSVKALRPATTTKYSKSKLTPKDVNSTAVRLKHTTGGKLKKIKSHWVLLGTDIKYQDNIPVEALQAAEKDKNDNPKFVTIKRTGGNEVRLECITYKTLKNRKSVWVFTGTAKEFQGDIPVAALQAAKLDTNGNPKFITMTDPAGTKNHLECITNATLASRKPHWVYLGTDMEYKGHISLEALQTAKNDKHGNPKFVTMIDDVGTKIQLECITDQTLKLRKPHWVFIGTDKEYQGDIPAEALEITKSDDNGNPKFVTMTDDAGTKIQLECITAQKLRQRKLHWVLPGTKKEYNGNIATGALETAEKDSNDNPKLVTIKKTTGIEVHPERMTASSLRKRKSMWVFTGTAKEYQGDIPAEVLEAAEKNNSGNPKFITLTDGIHLEHVTDQTLKQRKPHWVLLGTDKEYLDDIPVAALQAAELDTNGNPKFVTMTDHAGNMIHLEHVTDQTLKQRKPHWVLLGTDKEYPGDIPVAALQAAKLDANGNPKFITMTDPAGTKNHLECITNATLASRKPHWVFLGTNKEYQVNIPAEDLELAERDANGNPKFITIKETGGAEIHLECITNQTLRQRKSHWVFLGTDKKYKDNIPAEILEAAEKDKYGNPKFVTIINDGGTEIQLEHITIETLKSRKPHWVFLSTDKAYQGDIPPEALQTAKKDKHGNPKFITMTDAAGNQIHLECITTSTLDIRNSCWIFTSTNQKYQGDIPVEALESARKDKNNNPKFLTIKGADGTEIELEKVTVCALKRRIISAQKAACSPLLKSNASLNQSPIITSAVCDNAKNGLPLTPLFAQKRHKTTSEALTERGNSTQQYDMATLNQHNEYQLPSPGSTEPPMKRRKI
jgi:hypothetical protein